MLRADALHEVSQSGALEDMAEAAEGAALEFLRALPPLLLGPPAWLPSNEHIGAAFLEVSAIFSSHVHRALRASTQCGDGKSCRS